MGRRRGGAYPQLGLLEVVQRQRLQVVRARVVLHHRQLGTASHNRTHHYLPPCRGAPPSLQHLRPPPSPPPTLASLKLSSRASRLAPASCTLAIDMTLPKKEKEATSSSFSRCSRWDFPSGGEASGYRSGSYPSHPHP